MSTTTAPPSLEEVDLQSGLLGEFDLAPDDLPPVAWVSHLTPDGWISAIRWGTAPHAVLLHGRAPTQTAHAWDPLALAWGAPLLAVDLPGHGLSARRRDGTYAPRSIAPAVGIAVAERTTRPTALVGASFGGLVGIAVAAARPELVSQLVLIDITPGQPGARIPALDPRLDPEAGFDSQAEIVRLLVELGPPGEPERIARNVRHATWSDPDGRWFWRRDAGVPIGTVDDDGLDRAALWDDLEAFDGPVTLVRGADSGAVTPADEAELLRRRPDALVVVIDAAGHEVQRDRPHQLAQVLADLTAGS